MAKRDCKSPSRVENLSLLKTRSDSARRRGGADLADIHRRCGVRPRIECVIAVADEVSGRLVPGKRLAQLLCGPGAVECSVTAMCTTRRRSWAIIRRTNSKRHVAVGTTKKSAALSDMICQERAPRLRRRARVADHVFRDGGLTDLNAHLQQFAMDPRRPRADSPATWAESGPAPPSPRAADSCVDGSSTSRTTGSFGGAMRSPSQVGR
jgi:hypothetical protein